MNKNTHNIRNMGLAKANTSLGLQSLKKMERFSKENQNSNPINVMEDSLNFSDSAESPVRIETLMTDITNSDSDVSPVDSTVPCVSNNGRTSTEGISNTVADTTSMKIVSDSVLENHSEPLLPSAGADAIEAMDTSNTSVTLTDMFSSALDNCESSKILTPQTSVSALPSPVLGTGDSTPKVSAIDTEANVSIEVSQPHVNDTIQEVMCQSESELPSETDVIPSQPSTSLQTYNLNFPKFVDIKLPVLNSKFPGSPVTVSSLFSLFTSSKLLTHASRLLQLCDNHVKCPVITDSRFGTEHPMPVRPEKSVCCSLSSQELESLESLLTEKRGIVSSAYTGSSRLLQKQLSTHIRKQISILVDHYQRKFQIPCQRPVKHFSTKSSKDLLDLKAELLQSEDVKNMSTAALVSLVRKLESSGSQTRLAAPKTGLLGNLPDASESTTLLFDPDDCSDIKHTSGVLLSALKNVLTTSDPYLTDLSEEESESETDDEETASETETTE